MRRLIGILSLLSLATVSACEFDEVTVPAGTRRPVVHVVLNAHEGQRFHVLLERTLGGRIDATERAYDPDDPIVSGGGEPIEGAQVVITSEFDQAMGIELVSTRADGKGRGVYEFLVAGCSFTCPTNGIILTRGVTYDLRIVTPEQEVITGRTTIPLATPRPDTVPRRTFDAENDTYVFSWPASESLRRYALQVQTPFGPFQTFSSVESLAVNGTLRNFQAERFPRVFVPGFLQELHALAVDQNYFDYFRSENSPFTGLGIVSSVTGATGVFGSILPIRRQQLDVVAPFDDPHDGAWLLVGDTTGFPARLTTWVDGTFASGKLQDVFDPDQQTRRGVIGKRDGATLRLAVLVAQSALDTAWTLAGEIRNDTLYTTSAVKGEQRWRRVPP